jgi:hypothetical protein
MPNSVGYLKVSILPGQVGLDVSRAIDTAVAELKSCDWLVLDLRGHLGGGLGVLRLMSHLTPAKLPIGYTITRRRAESGYDKSKLPKRDRLTIRPCHFFAPRPSDTRSTEGSLPANLKTMDATPRELGRWVGRGTREVTYRLCFNWKRIVSICARGASWCPPFQERHRWFVQPQT